MTAAAAAAPSAAQPPKPIRLFIVDDHPLVRDGLRARLGAMPNLEIVGEAGSGAEALALIDTVRCDLMLVDVGMKDMNGIDLAAQVLQRDPGQALHPAPHIVMLSMYDNPEYVQKAMQVGARGYVLKDAPAAEIVAAIEAVSAGGTFLSPAVSKKLFRNQAPRPLLTPRESEILTALGRGESSKQIARDLSLSVRTVEAHRQSIKRRLGIEGQAELIKYAVEHAREFGQR
ncbi:response regulator transcription factor [Variovorax sp. 770b2]|uniref:response regulator transcription factor n=1 Tax=Variovorax sp. 770b2 TaxID=1566271 RepID=UPI0008E359AA|nr:response regulator transcription factor [Variovorax sp. 770b2]SFP93291.1 two component transcriptional regulator, LuxR family [Variovorax sp. 770b2]